MYKKITLKNGLRIITVPLKNTQAVTVLILVGTGSKYETKDISGISHFLEHMLGKGTKRRPTTLKIAEVLDGIGGMHNAFTGKEFTGYWAKADSKHLDLVLDWISDSFLNSRLDSKDIEKERAVIIEEINMYLDSPMSHIGDLWEKLLYKDQPAGWFILGNKKNILNFKREQFLKYLKEHYTAQNIVICVAGNIKEEPVKEKIKKLFKNINTLPQKSSPKVVEKQEFPQSLIYFKKTDQTHLCLGVRGYNSFHPQRYTQEVLATILGGNMSSRLFISVRVERGIAYYIHSSSESNPDTGYLVTSAGVDNKKVEETIALILKEYKFLKNKKISAKELKKAKDYLKGVLSLSLESSDSQASFYAGQELLAKEVLTLKQQCDKIDEVTREDISAASKEIFQPDKLNLALIGPFKEKKQFEKLLKI